MNAFVEKRPAATGCCASAPPGRRQQVSLGLVMRASARRGAQSLPEEFSYCGRCGRPLNGAPWRTPPGLADRAGPAALAVRPIRPAVTVARPQRSNW
jgi:hypothetical protein